MDILIFMGNVTDVEGCILDYNIWLVKQNVYIVGHCFYIQVGIIYYKILRIRIFFVKQKLLKKLCFSY